MRTHQHALRVDQIGVRERVQQQMRVERVLSDGAVIAVRTETWPARTRVHLRVQLESLSTGRGERTLAAGER